MNKFNKTLEDLKKISKTKGFDFLITRFNKDNTKNVSDLDVLVKNKDFSKVVKGFAREGYKAQSHDHALGGRLPGYQINIVKPGSIKIDLHKDFTWRAKRYLDLDVVWKKERLVDPFLVFISIIFEKTYVDIEDYEYIWKHKSEIFNKSLFLNQSKKHGWANTFKLVKNWNPDTKKMPIFMPVYMVLISYVEKFNLTSFLYYVFFRLRYQITKQLPYD